MTPPVVSVGFVHAGPPEHGISRYGRVLAAAAARRPDVRVRESEMCLDGPLDRAQILAAAERLRDVDVVHLQYNNQRRGSVWGADWRQLENLKLFAAAVRRPVVATIHDVYPVWASPWTSALRRPVREGRKLATSGPQLATRWWLQWHAARVIVCSEEERKRLSWPVGRRPCVIPHFVEARHLVVSRDEARRSLDLQGKRVVTLLGYIHQRKGHQLLIDALPHLPADVVVVFAGGPLGSDRGFVDTLRDRARSLGVAERLRITGYLPEQQLEEYLVASDLGVCPFRTASASGSLSTWISAERPVVASNIPLIAEYNAVEAGAIATFAPYTAQALASAVNELLERTGTGGAPGVARLRQQLLIPAIVDRHVAAYRAAAEKRV